ncbi:antibiotic biosynthesis monooxygenase [Myxococcus sp. AM011]|uniref:putative quinol monooxygenase n=1 Tax=Myxococcus sp. AM011 TaxID=2745200 RepID=UPI001595104B|nr:antibiotic biosynthesis monooxygenase [Myxococcus sp. AM011]NVJ19744.1 antibiotic biosynthesis monooxygenase [Myxococcus sp. AM011]
MKATFGFRATMTAAPGRGDELVALLLTAVSDTGLVTNKDCVLYRVGRSASNPDVVHVTEGWTTKEAHAANFSSLRSQALIARLAPLVTGEAQYQDEVPVGGTLEAGAVALARSA